MNFQSKTNNFFHKLRYKKGFHNGILYKSDDGHYITNCFINVFFHGQIHDNGYIFGWAKNSLKAFLQTNLYQVELLVTTTINIVFLGESRESKRFGKITSQSEIYLKNKQFKDSKKSTYGRFKNDLPSKFLSLITWTSWWGSKPWSIHCRKLCDTVKGIHIEGRNMRISKESNIF